MRGFQRFADLSGNSKGVVKGQWSACNLIGECFSADQLHDEEVSTIRLLEAVDCSDVRMTNRSQQARFAFESCDAVGVSHECFMENFYGDRPAELRVSGLIDLPHAAGAQMRRDFVVSE